MSKVPHRQPSRPGLPISQPAERALPADTQEGRPLTITTPLGDNVVLITGLSGDEGISRLFRFRMELIAADQTLVAFERLLGAEVTAHLRLPEGGVRHFSGICAGIGQGMRSRDFTRFELEVVPSFWKLTRRVQSRIFQNATVPEILAKVLADVPNVTFKLSGTFHPRDYCVQYRESDHDFACRLMEEEGIAFYFTHEADHHGMVVTNTSDFPSLAGPPLILQSVGADTLDEPRVIGWEKRQRLRSGRVTLRDHIFELPHDHLEATSSIQPSVQVGQTVHRLNPGGAEGLELYLWPGDYARRFDGVDRSGNRLGTREVGKVYQDGRRTAEIRMQQEAVEAIVIEGHGRYRQMIPGHKFQIREQAESAYEGQSSHDGEYLIVTVGHHVEAGLEYRSGDRVDRLYGNSFTCIPAGLPYRPPLSTPRPVIQGPQTAVVVHGPGDDEIFTDPYGRVKVKFHWDRDGEPNPESSCWIRVAQSNSGSGFGMIYVPRAGQEVVVQFQDGDPDQPLITGSVYNPDQMPPFELPAGKMKSGFRSNSYPGGGGLNEITVDDSKTSERMYIHAQHNKDEVVGNNRTAKVAIDSHETIGNNHTQVVSKNVTESVGADKTVTIVGNSVKKIQANETKAVTGNQDQSVDANATETVAGNKSIKVGGALSIDVGTTISLKAGTSITIECGSSKISMNSAGILTISGTAVTMAAAVNANVAAPLTNIAGGVMLNLVGAISTMQGIITKVGGTSTASLKGGEVTVQADAAAAFKGTEVTVAATGDTAIQGAIVRLN